MKYVVLVSRLLLGLAFFVFGLNDILMFMKPKADQLPTGDAGTMSTILMNSHWMTFVGCIMVVSGLLFLVGRFVPLAITLAAPVLVNILLFHLLLTQGHGIIPGAILTVLEVVLLLAYWHSFMPLLQPDPKFDTTKL